LGREARDSEKKNCWANPRAERKKGSLEAVQSRRKVNMKRKEKKLKRRGSYEVRKPRRVAGGTLEKDKHLLIDWGAVGGGKPLRSKEKQGKVRSLPTKRNFTSHGPYKSPPEKKTGTWARLGIGNRAKI